MAYEIIATLGPCSQTRSIWQAMIANGVTAFRLNTSHLTLPQLFQWLERLEPFIASVGLTIPVVLDLQGSKWRLGELTAFELHKDQTVELIHAGSTQHQHTLPVPHPDFFKAARLSSGEIILNDARIHLMIESVSEKAITARVAQGGKISSHKGITFSFSEYRKESISDKDQDILEQTRHLSFVRYAISYIKDSQEMSAYRSLFGREPYLIAKLERKQAIADAFQIADSADELWLCRGDLGAELGLKAMGEAVFQFSQLISSLPVPVIMAGQVLEHMTAQPSPTRSELCYLYDTLMRGYRGVVLSDETAMGKYPVESCKIAALYNH